MSISQSKAFPQLTKLGVPLHRNKEAWYYVFPKDVNVKLRDKGGPGMVLEFHKLFGIQTCPLVEKDKGALFASDAESVLERMFSGTLTGTQLFWD